MFQMALLWIASIAQEIDLSGFADILFLFIGLAQVALPIALALAVLLAVLDIIGIDVLKLAGTIKGR